MEFPSCVFRDGGATAANSALAANRNDDNNNPHRSRRRHCPPGRRFAPSRPRCRSVDDTTPDTAFTETPNRACGCVLMAANGNMGRWPSADTCTRNLKPSIGAATGRSADDSVVGRHRRYVPDAETYRSATTILKKHNNN